MRINNTELKGTRQQQSNKRLFAGTHLMKWEIDYIEDHGIVKAKTSGQIGWNDKIKLSEEMLAAGRAKNANAFLVDHKETAFGLSVLEIDRLPDTFRSIGFSEKDKMAILCSPESPNKDLFVFLQNVFTLSSLQIRVFTDPDEATAWLKKKSLKQAKNCV